MYYGKPLSDFFSWHTFFAPSALTKIALQGNFLSYANHHATFFLLPTTALTATNHTTTNSREKPNQPSLLYTRTLPPTP